MADHEVEQKERQVGHRKGKGKKERNWKNKERESLIALYDKKEVAYQAYCQIDAQMSEKYVITRDYYKSKWEI